MRGKILNSPRKFIPLYGSYFREVVFFRGSTRACVVSQAVCVCVPAVVICVSGCSGGRDELLKAESNAANPADGLERRHLDISLGCRFDSML